MNLLNLCIVFNKSKVEKCTDFYNQFSEILIYFFSFNNVLILTLLVLWSLSIVIFKNYNSILSIYFHVFIILIIYLSIITQFPVRIPWVDDWEWIENLYTYEKPDIKWLFEKTNIHFIVIPKIVFYVIVNFLNSNFYLISLLSVFLIFLSFQFIVIKDSKSNYPLQIIILLLLFSPKIFPNISQFCNLAWFISLFFIAILNFSIHSQSKLMIILNILLIFISPFNFGLTYSIPIFIIVFIFFLNLRISTKCIYFFISILTIFLTFYLTSISGLSKDENTFNFISSHLFDSKKIIIFFGVLANIYVPWTESFKYISFSIGLIQFIIMVVIFVKSLNSNLIKNQILSFIQQNHLILYGLIFSFLIMMSRNDYQTIVAARYAIGSIIFQIGFFIYIFNNLQLTKTKISIIVNLFIIFNFISFLLPYQGFHWQIDRYLKSKYIIDCYQYNSQEKCNEESYKILFYDGEWFNYGKFTKIVKVMINSKTKVFEKIE